ncbi:MAG: N-acetyltransferase [Betaproteobacteria bacterium]|nr:N-acetyltransferase [Betaproteobacteria bacterium]
MLQLLETSPDEAVVAQVFTRPEYRRQGAASELMERARKDFRIVRHSEHLTDEGEAWSRAVGNPSETFIPPASVAKAALEGLELRRSLPPSQRCCTDVGIRRAVQLGNRQPVSIDTLRRMRSYFQRHAVDSRGRGWGVDSRGWQAWLLWGGDPGRKWAEDVIRKYDRATPNSAEENLEDAKERLDEWIRHLDFSYVQEGSDLAFHRRDARGFHFTSQRNFDLIAKEGLGGKVDFNEHEFPYWVAMPFIAPDDAARVLMRFESGDKNGAYRQLQALLDEVPDLRVVWFYRDPGMYGQTASSSQRCISFDLNEVGDWLAEHAESAHQFTDHADGYAVAWIGPRIPPAMLSECIEE